MKNVLIGILVIISSLSLGFIVYNNFITTDEVLVKECNKEELCEEYIYDGEDEDEAAIIESDSFYSKDGKIYKLDIYDVQKIKTENIKLNGKNVIVENKNDFLYINSKQIEYAMELYVTNYYIFAGGVGQSGFCFTHIIDENGNVTNIDDNEIIGEFQAYNIYLTDNGDIAAIGSDFCGIECSSGKKLLKFSRNNGKFEITKEKYNN